jgi:hypothetical protein
MAAEGEVSVLVRGGMFLMGTEAAAVEELSGGMQSTSQEPLRTRFQRTASR